MMQSSASLLEQVITAHGGLERWQRAGELAVQHSSGGFAFAAKFQGRPLRKRLARVATALQRTVTTPYPGSGRRGVFEQGAVRIETDGGRLLAQRLDPRSDLRSLRHRLWWDKLDLLYFTGSALWNYMATPFIFGTPGFELQELAPWEEGGEVWRRLAVTFPTELHTHSRQQVFYFSADGLLKRLDYTAEEFGEGAKAAHYCFDHREFDGLVFPTRRRVFPRGPDNRPRRRPLLVWIDIQAVDVGAGTRLD
jgi:hypothetical protein